GGKDHAEGFCYVNDIALAITECLKKGCRVAYIDIDVHHGNGIQDAFYGNKNVLTISLHESGRSLYPGSGFENETGINEGLGYTVNIPLLKGSDDEVYLYAFESLVPQLVTNYKPHIVFAEIGGDTHIEDPLANLALTSNSYKEVIGIINKISPKIMATGGGGYNPSKTAALWTLAWAAFCGIEPEDHFAGSIGGMMYGPETDSGNLDDAPYYAPKVEKDRTLHHAENIVAAIRDTVFPIHGLDPLT
ncbi:MAG: acetoin utilization protein AcuC, partial [bacterium]|nr:acetoin utilization protein AcuC [bacterium]